MNIIKREALKLISFLHEIINDESIFPPFHDAIKSKNGITAMDIGCGFPAALIVLNEKYNLSKAICIDKSTEETVVHNTIVALKKSWQAKTVSEFYFKAGGGCMKTIEQFDEIFSKYSFWEKDADFVLSESKDNVDILICQNFLHFIETVEGFEHWMLNFKVATKKKDSIIFLRVERDEDFDYETFKRVLSKHYDGTMFEFFVDDSWDHSYFINLK